MYRHKGAVGGNFGFLDSHMKYFTSNPEEAIVLDKDKWIATYFSYDR